MRFSAIFSSAPTSAEHALGTPRVRRTGTPRTRRMSELQGLARMEVGQVNSRLLIERTRSVAWSNFHFGSDFARSVFSPRMTYLVYIQVSHVSRHPFIFIPAFRFFLLCKNAFFFIRDSMRTVEVANTLSRPDHSCKRRGTRLNDRGGFRWWFVVGWIFRVRRPDYGFVFGCYNVSINHAWFKHRSINLNLIFYEISLLVRSKLLYLTTLKL